MKSSLEPFSGLRPERQGEPRVDRFTLLLGGIYRHWRRQVDSALKELNLTDATRAPLMMVYRTGHPLRQKDLAQKLFLETSSLVRLLDHLRALGLVNWEVDEQDRRGKVISITPLGMKTAKQIQAQSTLVEKKLLASLNAQEAEQMLSALEKMAEAFEQGAFALEQKRE